MAVPVMGTLCEHIGCDNQAVIAAYRPSGELWGYFCSMHQPPPEHATAERLYKPSDFACYAAGPSPVYKLELYTSGRNIVLRLGALSIELRPTTALDLSNAILSKVKVALSEPDVKTFKGETDGKT